MLSQPQEFSLIIWNVVIIKVSIWKVEQRINSEV